MAFLSSIVLRFCWVESKPAAYLSSLHLDFDLGRHLFFESNRELVFFCLAFYHCLVIHDFAEEYFLWLLNYLHLCSHQIFSILEAFYNSYLLHFCAWYTRGQTLEEMFKFHLPLKIDKTHFPLLRKSDYIALILLF